MKELIKIQNELKSPKTQAGYSNRYKYRKLDYILLVLKPMCEKLNVLITLDDSVIEVGGRVYLCSMATISNKDEKVSVKGWAREELSKNGMDVAQLTGSASTYSRKTALCNLLLIDDSAEDPDKTGNQSPKHPDIKPKSGQAVIQKQPLDMKKDCIKRINDGMTNLNNSKITVPKIVLDNVSNLDKLELNILIGYVEKLKKAYIEGKK